MPSSHLPLLSGAYRHLAAAFALLLPLGVAGCSDEPPVEVQSPGEEPGLSCDERKGAPSPVRLLTRREYDNTARALFGDPELTPASAFAPENELHGFQNMAEAHLASPLLVEQLALAAEDLANLALERGFLGLRAADGAPALDCPLDGLSAACAERFVERFVTHAFRRPLHAAEQAAFVELYERASQRFEDGEALSLVVRAALQAPSWRPGPTARRRWQATS